MTDPHEAELRARCDLLCARDEAIQSRQLEHAIFEAYAAASKAALHAASRESAAFDIWYAISKSHDEAAHD